MTEPHITINGRNLSLAEAMTVRVAVTHFLIDMREEGACGTDVIGEETRRGYLHHARRLALEMAEEKKT